MAERLNVESLETTVLLVFRLKDHVIAFPDIMTRPIPKDVLDNLTRKSRACIDNFAIYLATLAPVDSSVVQLFY